MSANKSVGNVLSDRSANLLTMLVNRYIREGIPVASKALARESNVGLSPASVRSVMAELEEAGFLHSPHTSAGRVPTAKGYRLFVDSAVTTSELQGDLIETLKTQFDSQLDAKSLAKSASNILSDMTHQAGLVMLPRSQAMSFRQIEFLPLSSRRVLVILVLNEHEVQNRVIHTEQDFSAEQLQIAAAFVNEHYAGRTVRQVREELLRSMREDRSVIDQLMQSAIDFANKALEDIDNDGSDYVVAGQANLIDEQSAQPHDMHRLRELFEAFQQKKDILHLMESCAQAQGIQVFIGEEAGYEVLDDFSVITAPYQANGEPVGVLAVIGPTRMAYERVVPMVDVTAKLLTAALKS